MENTHVGAYSREDFIKNGEIRYSKLEKEFDIPEKEAKKIPGLNEAIISGDIEGVIRNVTIPDGDGIHDIKGAVFRLAAAFCKGEAFEAVYKAMDKNYADLKEGGETNISHTYINDADKNGCTPLLIAAKAGNLENLKFLLSEPGADITMKTKDGLTIHELACLSGDLEMVKYVFEKYPYSKAPEKKEEKEGIKPSQIVFKVRTPNEPSTKNTSTKIRRNKKIEQKPIEQKPIEQKPIDCALECAIKSDNPEVINYLLENDYKIEKDDFSNAVLLGNVKIAELIYSKIILSNDDKKKLWLSTDCLEKAIKSKNKEMVSFLIDNFYSINKPRQFHTGENDTPLQFAIKTKNIEMIEYLINEKNAPIYPINPNSPIKNNYDNDVNYLKEAIKTGDEGIFNLIKEAYSKKLQARNARLRGTKKKDLRSVFKLENNSCLLNAITSKNPEILKSVIRELKYSDLLKGLGNSGKKNAIDLLYSDEYKSLRTKICKDNSEIEYKIRKAKLKQEIEKIEEVESISEKTIKVLNFDFKRDNLSFLSTNLERLKKQIKEKKEISQNLKDFFKKMKEKQEKILDMMLKINEKQGDISKTQIEESKTTQAKIITPKGKLTAKTVKKGNQRVTGSTKLEPMENEEKTKIEQALLDAEKEMIEEFKKEDIIIEKQKGGYGIAQ